MIDTIHFVSYLFLCLLYLSDLYNMILDFVSLVMVFEENFFKMEVFGGRKIFYKN